MEIRKTKIKGTARPGYWLNCGVLAGGSLSTAKFKIDTGADLTCVPEKAVADPSSLQHTAPLLIQMADGKEERRYPKLVTLIIDGQKHTPGRGVLIVNRDTGFIGNDIIDKLDLMICGGVMIIEGGG